MRKVRAEIWDRDLKARREITGTFHQWGCGYEEFREGPGNFTMAIIELANGKTVTAVPEDVTFLDRGINP